MLEQEQPGRASKSVVVPNARWQVIRGVVCGVSGVERRCVVGHCQGCGPLRDALDGADGAVCPVGVRCCLGRGWMTNQLQDESAVDMKNQKKRREMDGEGRK